MNQQHFASTVQPIQMAKKTVPELARVQAEKMVEHLHFTISIAQSSTQLAQAVAIRHGAYARHVPSFAETLQVAESLDSDDGVIVLLASSKLDGSPLGTMRIQTNCFKPLELEDSLALPKWLATQRLAEAARLGVTQEKIGRLVKTMLFKAYFQYCQINNIDWMVITARSPVDRQYDRLLFDDVYPGMGYVPVHHVDNMPHRVMKFEVGTAQERWAKARHPMYEFIFNTDHPDINLRASGMAPRRAVAPSHIHTINGGDPQVPMARFAHA